MLTVGSLFSGIGGLDLGLERAGMKVLWQVEIDDYCNKVLEKHWPGVRRYGDIKGIRWSEVEPVDLICGGFPCQPVSVAGAKKGDKDDRWLWPEFLRAICEVRPRYALMENVLGLLSTDDGRLARSIHGDLAEAGYHSEQDCISAKEIGAPHRRERVFIMAYPEDEGSTGRVGFSANDSVFGQKWNHRRRRGRSIVGCKALAHTTGEGFNSKNIREEGQTTRQAQWDSEPDLARVVDGPPTRMDKHRIKAIGNAVVPQVAEYIGRLIVEADGT